MPHHASPPRPSPASKSRSHGHVPQEFTDASRGERLQRVLADAGVASRRACEELIASGQVTVNGKPVTALPAWVDVNRDRIAVDGRPVRIKKSMAEGARKVYVMLHKPRRVITTTNDPEGRVSVTEIVEIERQFPELKGTRLFPVGRLDADSSGLLLLTNDGELTNRLTHPRYGVPKQYHVLIRGDLTSDDVEKLRKGVILAHSHGGPDEEDSRSKRGGNDGEEARPRHVRVKKAKMEDVRIIGRQRDQAQGDRTQISVTLREGQNREIRRMLARLGYNVRRLRRVAIGPLKLGKLEVGSWRMLLPNEIRALRKAAGIEGRS